MTRRERMEHKVEKRREWAESRQAKATALHSYGGSMRTDWAFITQPGRIPEREKMNRKDAQAFEHTKKAAEHESKADGIESQLENSIFTDDPDAIERLTEKMEALQAKQQTMKDVNACFRKGGFDALAEQFPEYVAPFKALQKVCPYERKPYPSYAMSNNSSEIRRCKKRIEEIGAAKSGKLFRIIAARFDSDGDCGHALSKGDTIGYNRVTKETRCVECLRKTGFNV